MSFIFRDQQGKVDKEEQIPVRYIQGPNETQRATSFIGYNKKLYSPPPHTLDSILGREARVEETKYESKNSYSRELRII